MRFDLVRLICAMLLVMVMAACTQAPQPYRHSRTGTDTGFLKLRDAGTIQILPVEGVNVAMAKILAEGLRDALALRNIPATLNAVDDPAYRIRAQAVLTWQQKDDADIGFIYWTFMDRSNRVVFENSQQIEAAFFEWEYGDHEMINNLITGAAEDFASLLQDESEKQAVRLDPKERDVAFKITHITGARGDGAQSLRRAMGRVLRQYGARVRNIVNEDTYLLSAEINILDPFEGQERVLIVWKLENALGEEIGLVKLNNQMEAGRFDRPWGDMALEIAQASIQGIGNVVERYRAEQQFDRSRDVPATTAPPGRRNKVSLTPF